MDILITGYTAGLTNELCAPLLENHKIVVASDDAAIEGLDKRISTFNISALDVDFKKLFNTHSFDVVLFLSQPVFAGPLQYDEYHKLESCLSACNEHDVNRLVYLCNDYFFHENVDDQTDFSALFNSCRKLCEFYNERKTLSAIVMRTPVMYAAGEAVSLIGSAISQVKSRASIAFEVGKSQQIGFISQKDIGELLLRVVESWPTDMLSFSVPALDTMTIGELADLFKKHYPTCRFTFSSVMTGAPAVEYAVSIPRMEWDWVPLYDLPTELEKIIKSEDAVYKTEKPTVFSRIAAFFKKHVFILQLIEILLGFILMEFLIRITGTTVQFRYVDFRLIYIVVLATFHGMGAGLISAAFASVSLLAATVIEASNWTATIYDIGTWLPFIFFFLVGSITGYVKDRLRNDNINLQEEKALLEEKFVLLNDFYSSALVNKDRYKNQIMSYRDSFGRIFEISKQLDSTLVEEVFSKALEALEGVLSNKSICIYGCYSKSQFARIMICSREIRPIMSKSIAFNSYPEMFGNFKDETVWVNRDRLMGYPEYAMPIYENGELIAMITVQKTAYDQMEIYYENLIKIIGGLIRISLIRAIEYTRESEAKRYVPDTHVLLPQYFGEIIRVKQAAKENGTGDFELLRFDVPEGEFVSFSNALFDVLRESDHMGLGNDRRLYVCLNQATSKDTRFVLERIAKAGLIMNENAHNGE